MDEPRSHARQMIGSLLAAVVIIALAIAVVTAKLGPTSTAELEARQDIAKERAEEREARLEAFEDRREKK
jgi:hypothetical protein